MNVKTSRENPMDATDKSVRPSPRKPYARPLLICYGHVKDIVQGGGGKNKDLDNKNTKSCWIAEALYGVHDPRTTLIRAWLAQAAVQRRRWWLFAALYKACGRTLAGLLYRGQLPRRWLRPLFDSLLMRALDESGRAMKTTAR
jgi:hypothetical protein